MESWVADMIHDLWDWIEPRVQSAVKAIISTVVLSGVSNSRSIWIFVNIVDDWETLEELCTFAKFYDAENLETLIQICILLKFGKIIAIFFISNPIQDAVIFLSNSIISFRKIWNCNM
jgi:hypothetical protein